MIRCVTCLLGVFCLLLPVRCEAGAAPFHIVVPDATTKSVRVLSVTPDDGGGVTLVEGTPLRLSWKPLSVTVDTHHERLFVTGGSKTSSHVASIVLDGSALVQQSESQLAAATGYTSVDRAGKYLLSSHYGDGRIDVYAIAANGIVGNRVFHLATPNKAAHCVLTTRDNRFVYVPCVKEHNALYQYAFDERTGKLHSLKPFNAGPPALFGPRHLAFHPVKNVAYFSNEQQLGVSVYRIEEAGNWQPCSTRQRCLAGCPTSQVSEDCTHRTLLLIILVRVCSSPFEISFTLKTVCSGIAF